MAEYDIESAVALLSRAPLVYSSLLLDLPAAWLAVAEVPGAWSPHDVVCHVADLERDAWLGRLQAMLEHGTAAPLPSVDRERFRTTYDGVPLHRVLADFDRLREINLKVLAELRLGRSQLDTTGAHPALGEVRVSQLLSAWVVHDLTHLAQISRALAAQYRDAVGPWREYLSVLRPRVEVAR